MVQAEQRPTKREWLNAYMDGLERSRYTGAVDILLTYRNGDIALLISTVKPDAAPERVQPGPTRGAANERSMPPAG